MCAILSHGQTFERTLSGWQSGCVTPSCHLWWGRPPCRIHKRGMYEQGTSGLVGIGVADTGHTSSPHGLSLRRVLKGKEENLGGVSRER